MSTTTQVRPGLHAASRHMQQLRTFVLAHGSSHGRTRAFAHGAHTGVRLVEKRAAHTLPERWARGMDSHGTCAHTHTHTPTCPRPNTHTRTAVHAEVVRQCQGF